MGFLEHVNIAMVEEGDGRAIARLEVADQHLNRRGMVHGGVIATLVDTAIGRAIASVVGPDASIVTANLSIAFLAPCREEPIEATGRAVCRGRRLLYGEAEVLAGGRLVARAHGTWYARRASNVRS